MLESRRRLSRTGLLSFALFVALSPALLAETVLDVSAFGAKADSGQDATEAFQKAVAAARDAEKPVVLDLPAGRYDFFSAHATRKACYYSNATEPGSDGMRTIALDLSDLDHVTLRGNGSTLLMHGAMTMVAAERSTNLVLAGLAFDFARPPVSEIAVIEKGQGYWIGQVHPDSLYEITDGRRILWKGEDWSSYHNLCQSFDTAKQTTWRSDDPTSGVTAVEDLGEGKLKFTAPDQVLSRVRPGLTYQFRNVVRDQCGMWFSRCRNVAMNRVQVRAMRGFGILCQFTENIDYDHLEVGPRADSGRTACAAADILHFTSCRGGIHVANSKLSAAHDDAMNVHGVHLQVMGVDGDGQRLTVRFAHEQTWGFKAFEAGDTIQFIKPDTLQSFGIATVKAVEATPGSHEQRITIDRAAPQGLEAGKDVVENITWTPSVEVTNCEVGQVPTRGFLLTTRQPVVIRGCRFFRTQMPCILVEDDARGWFESGPVRDLTVQGNSFFECQSLPVQFSPQNTVYEGPVHSNVRITDNEFVLTGLKAMDFKSTSGILISGNRFRRMREEDGTLPPVDKLVLLDHCGDVQWGENRVEAGEGHAKD